MAQDYTLQAAVMPHLSQPPEYSAKLNPVTAAAAFDKAKVQRSLSTSVARDVGLRGRMKPGLQLHELLPLRTAELPPRVRT